MPPGLVAVVRMHGGVPPAAGDQPAVHGGGDDVAGRGDRASEGSDASVVLVRRHAHPCMLAAATGGEGSMRGLRTLLLIAYLVIGIIVAANRDYLGSLDTIKEIVSALLAIVLWPLVLIGVNLHIRG